MSVIVIKMDSLIKLQIEKKGIIISSSTLGWLNSISVGEDVSKGQCVGLPTWQHIIQSVAGKKFMACSILTPWPFFFSKFKSQVVNI